MTATFRNNCSPKYSAVDLGIHVWAAHELEEYSVIDVSQFAGSFARAEVSYLNRSLWVTVSLCRVSHDNSLVFHVIHIKCILYYIKDLQETETYTGNPVQDDREENLTNDEVHD